MSGAQRAKTLLQADHSSFRKKCRAAATWGMRFTAVIGIFPNDEAIIRPVGALMLVTNDEWAGARRHMSLETLARVTDNTTVRLPAVAT